MDMICQYVFLYIVTCCIFQCLAFSLKLWKNVFLSIRYLPHKAGREKGRGREKCDRWCLWIGFFEEWNYYSRVGVLKGDLFFFPELGELWRTQDPAGLNQLVILEWMYIPWCIPQLHGFLNNHVSHVSLKSLTLAVEMLIYTTQRQCLGVVSNNHYPIFPLKYWLWYFTRPPSSAVTHGLPCFGISCRISATRGHPSSMECH